METDPNNFTSSEAPEYLAPDYSNGRDPKSIGKAIAETMQDLAARHSLDIKTEITYLEIQSTYGYLFDDQRLQDLRIRVADEQATLDAPQTE